MNLDLIWTHPSSIYVIAAALLDAASSDAPLLAASADVPPRLLQPRHPPKPRRRSDCKRRDRLPRPSPPPPSTPLPADCKGFNDAASECRVILDIVESAWPDGMTEGVRDECKLEEVFHKALELLPILWKKAGFLDEVIAAYRRALIRPWNLDRNKCASIQKELAATLLYSGSEVALPMQLQQLWGSGTPKSNIEEVILLLLIPLRKSALKEISWDPEIMNHLTFALSLSGQFEFLASHVEQMLPGIYKRAERWYILALCYSAANLDNAAVNILILSKGLGLSERKHKLHLPSFLLGAKLFSKDLHHASEGVNFAKIAFEFASNQDKHFMGIASHLLGVFYGLCSTSFTSDSHWLSLHSDALRSLQYAASIEKDKPELVLYLGLENAVQRNLTLHHITVKAFETS